MGVPGVPVAAGPDADNEIEVAEVPPDEGLSDSALSMELSGGKEKHWFLVKSKDGKVRVCQAWERTPKTIAGPFPTKEAARRAKES